MQRKDTILTILKTYEIYFDYMSKETNSSTEEDDNISRFKEFYKHKDYFDKLDFSSAVMFFDNLFHLKERLQLPNKVYLDIESNFFLFIFCRKYLERYEQSNYSYFVSRWITFQERLSLERQMCNFKEILDRTELSKDNIVAKLPEATVRTLINLPQIYGQFLIFRLQHYLNTATEITVKDLKSILIIERCLQVMGECCKESDFNSVQRIIALALPKDFTGHLKQIRNRLAHIKPHELLSRNNLEKDVELFVGIQSELIKLKKLLLKIYAAHKYEMDQLLILHSIKSVCKARKKSILEKHENQLRAILPSPEMEENQISMPSDSCQSSWKRYFDDMHTSLKNEINELNRNGNILDKNITSRYKLIIQNIISSTEEVLKKLKVADPQKIIEELDSHFWCLENILTFITKDPKLAMYRRTLMSTIKVRKSLFTGIRNGAHQYQKTNQSTTAITDDQPVADFGIIENQKSLRTEETYNNNQRDINPVNTFENFGVLFDTTLGSSTFPNENGDKESSHKRVKSYRTNDAETEINGENCENGFFQNMFNDDISEKINDTMECKQVDDIDGNTEHLQKLILTEENDLPFSETNNIIHDDWLLADIFNNYQDSTVNCEAEDPASMMDAERNWKKNSKFNAFKEDVATILNNYEVIAYNMFKKIPGKKERNIEFHFGCIEKYCLILKGWTILSKKEKESILESVPKQLQNIPELKQEIKSLLKEKNHVTKEIEVELKKLNLKNQEIKEIAENIKFGLINDAESIVDSARNYFLDLKNMLELEEIDKKECELLCKKLEIPDNVKDILMKLVPGQNKKIPGNQFEFLRNRIKMLKNILIDENVAIQQLWERAITPRRKMHVKEKIIQLYLNNSQIQAAVETLLFDCMTILSSKELKNLWKKTTNLFNGINLRNVLAHGHPLLESVRKRR
ncbi:hypothetical protein HNY73_017387 [Argiope bruennichi]|uniref:Uncharacterized protein n=1 Tax=Argiope bruennichi TaxID=94029 RepID=A0A8T0ELL0_ARGBR|nr:hypothetical protein HNY73_017387 [Argiope bruennichi]